MTNYPTVDSELFKAWLGGYMGTMRAVLGPIDDAHWRRYLQGLEALETGVLGWLDRNTKEA